jgi:glycosyltransferase involved in cell wall biosynthesis
LRELLPALIAEVEEANRIAIRVELILSDNASTDETEIYLQDLSCRSLNVYRNEKNIGGDRNFLACVERASGTYVWLFGDDELIVPGGITRILKLLSNEHPILVILRDGIQELGVAEEVIYPNYGMCVREEMKGDVVFALSHTLITANIFHKDSFDQKEAVSKLYTNYAHMYGLLNGLKRGGRIVMKTGVFRSREQRAQFDRWPFALCVKQAGYLWRLADAFDVPRLRRIAFRLALNLPVEILSCCAHKVFPRRFGRT